VYFTKKAVDDFKAKNPNTNITDLKGNCITISDWSLEMCSVNSQDVFTSYGGLEVRLICKSFSHAHKESKNFVLSTHPSNIYRDVEIKTTIQNFQHGRVHAAAAGAKTGLPDISSFKNSSKIDQGVVGATTNYNFKEGKSTFVSLDNIFKQEKGASALSKLNQSVSSGKVKATGGAKKSKSSKGIKKSTKTATGALMRQASGANERSAVLGAKGPNVQSPGNAGERGSANISTMADFKKMVSMIKNKKSSMKK